MQTKVRIIADFTRQLELRNHYNYRLYPYESFDYNARTLLKESTENNKNEFE